MMDHEQLHDLMRPDWTPSRHAAVRERIARTRRRRARARQGLWVGGMAAAAVLLVLGGLSLAPGDETEVDVAGHDPPAAPAGISPSPILFNDGSSVTPQDGDTQVVVAVAGRERTRVALHRGQARFKITPDPRREFVVEAGEVTVAVLGTEFDCRRDEGRVTVEVLRGRVRVSWPGGATVLSRGERQHFPPESLAAAVEPGSPDPGAASPSTAAVRGESPAAGTQGSGGPSPATAPAPGSSSRAQTSASALMKAADAARARGEPAEALPLLRRVVDEHPRDPRAAPAAFAMGRIQMKLGRPAAAAASYASAGRLGARTSLAEHALAREVEAWAAAGQTKRAQRRAREYLRRFPDGPRAPEVRRLGGEAPG